PSFPTRRSSDLFSETLGVNDRVALAQAEKTMKLWINERHMNNGVTIIDPDHTYIHPDVVIAQDVIIHPGSMITGASIIKANAEIGAHSEIHSSIIGGNAIIHPRGVIGSQVGTCGRAGPYGQVSPELDVENESRIGNSGAVKKATNDEQSIVPHFCCFGNADFGNHANIGCGIIAVHYD